MRDTVMRASMSVYRMMFWQPIAAAAASPERAQHRALANILSANSQTRFGREHGFASAGSPVEFRRRVPLLDYEQLRPYIDEQRQTGAPALTCEAPLFYAQTSGSTGAPKLIPVTRSMLRMHKHEQALFSYLQYRACPAAFDGRALGIMGAAVEGQLDSGHVVGSVSGHLYRSLPRAIQRRFVVPPEVSSIADYDLKYRVIVRLALNQPAITYIGTPNPSTFLRLIALLNEERDRLARSLETGVFDDLDSLEPTVRAAVASRITPMKEMARRIATDDELTFANVWPDIRLITTWTGGGCGIALGRLRSKLPIGAAVMELGYQSTEFRGSIALTTETAAGLPPLTHLFLEFVEQAAWDAGERTFLTLAELEQKRRYYVIVTTASGLYRYFMNDLVEVDGLFRRTPLVRFVQKGKGVTSLTGEKLYEAQAIDSITSVARRHGFTPAFFMMIAEEERQGYRLFVESGDSRHPDTGTVAAAIDEELGRLNLEYHGKRASGRLRALDLVWLRPGAGEAFKAVCLRAGQREGQFKPPVLQYARELRFQFDDFVST